MSWVSLIIKIADTDAEVLGDALLEQGALSIDTHDAAAGTEQEQLVFGEPGEPENIIWQNAEVTALFDDSIDISAVVRAVEHALNLSTKLKYRLEKVEEQDWVRVTQAQFNPIQVSSRLWIVPTWHQFPDPKAINLILDPGLAFGTGSHPTTQLCLGWLDHNLKQGDAVLDYGCGSGILAIAALKLGADHIVGIDIDSNAVNASIDNAKRNQCDPEKTRFATAYEEISQQSEAGAVFDVVVANILANPLILLAPILASAVQSGGHIVLSGILQEQADEVMGTYRQWFEMQVSGEQDGWVLLTGNKK